MIVIKRDKTKVKFDREKIEKAIIKAMQYGSGVLKPQIAQEIAEDIEEIARAFRTITIEQIEDLVFSKLIEQDQKATAQSYEAYKAVQTFKRENNTTDESILSLLNYSNDEVMRENSNKNPILNSTQRDLIAGEVSKDLTDRMLLPPHIVQAHNEGKIHFHDKDYFISPMINCCLVNLKDMLENGTIINGKMVESPKSFQVACTVTTQIVAQVASGQYGFSE